MLREVETAGKREGGGSVRAVMKRPDYIAIIESLVGKIARLERTRMEMTREGQ